jgi:hypothetical protein
VTGRTGCFTHHWAFTDVIHGFVWLELDCLELMPKRLDSASVG